MKFGFLEAAAVLEGYFTRAQNANSWNWCKEALKLNEGQELSISEIVYAIKVLYEASATANKVLGYFVMASVLYPAAVLRATMSWIASLEITDFQTLKTWPIYLLSVHLSARFYDGDQSLLLVSPTQTCTTILIWDTGFLKHNDNAQPLVIGFG